MSLFKNINAISLLMTLNKTKHQEMFVVTKPKIHEILSPITYQTMKVFLKLK